MAFRDRYRLESFFPFMQWRQLVNRRTVQRDILAGLTGAIIVLPQGVAFALIAGLPPEYGLYSAMVPTVIAALFGSSFHLISGPTTAISIVVFSTISRMAEPFSADYIRLVLTLTFVAGCFQFLLGLARLGAVVNFVSHPVVVGFTSGAAILIATSQIGGVFGLAIPRGESFLHTWVDFISMVSQINLYVLCIAVVTFLTALFFKKLLPRLPGMLFAMVIGSVLCLVVGGKEHGVKLVGSLPAHLPPLSLPDLSMGTFRRLAPGALAVAMLGLSEAVSIARSIATYSHQLIDNNQEFIGQGLSNIAGSFFSGYASSGSFTRTGVNFTAGAKTPLAAVFASLFLLIVLLLIAPLTAYLPMPAMAGILLLVAYGLVDFQHIAHIFRASKQEGMVVATTLLSTLFVELEFAIYIGVILSLLLYLNRTSRPTFAFLAPDPETNKNALVNIDKRGIAECPQLKIVRVDGSIFFGAAQYFAEKLNEITKKYPEQAHILIVGGGINFIDVAGCVTFATESHRLRVTGRQLYFCSLKDEVVWTLRRGGCMKKIGEDNVFATKKDAIRAIVPKLDPERCRVCTLRVFHACDLMPGPA